MTEIETTDASLTIRRTFAVSRERVYPMGNYREGRIERPMQNDT
jgi:hypothetical protein